MSTHPIEKLWREHDLPEWFLGNGGTNTKLYALYDAIRADAAAPWQPIETRPEIDHQPGRQFILIEGHREHSGAKWYRQHAGEAFIRKPGSDDEMLQYRKSDILRLCADGDIEPGTAKVTHWMPGKYPVFPSSVTRPNGGSSE